MKKKLSIRFIIVSVVLLAGIMTVLLCAVEPKMHKPFQINILEYIIKINSDGSIESTKSITTQSVQEVQK